MDTNVVREKEGFNFDRFPIALQMLIGIGTLLLIAAIGFVVFIAFDLLLLDFDPIGKLASLLFGGK